MSKQINDPAADQAHDFPVYDGSAAANRFWTEGKQQIAQDGNTRAALHHFPVPNELGVEIINHLERTPTPVAHYAVGENGEFEALPMPDRRWIKANELPDATPGFRADLEAAIAAADLYEHDTGRTAADIAAELLKHPALQGYLELGQIAHLESCGQESEAASFQAQWERYGEIPADFPRIDIPEPAHFGVDLADGAADLSESEWLGNVKRENADPVPDKGERWTEHRRPQLMAIAKAGLDAIQELSGMQAELKGFHEDRPVESGPALQHWQGNKLMLIVSEVVEAHDEIRSGKHAWETYYPTMPPMMAGKAEGRGEFKPEGVPSEIADVIVRAADFAWTEGFDLSQIVLEKLEYNNTRPHKHGKGF